LDCNVQDQMMEYTILIVRTLSGLERKVNEYIKQGWRPQGSIGIEQNAQFNTVEYYFQAMIKENE
jgi:hypothetical protein